MDSSDSIGVDFCNMNSKQIVNEFFVVAINFFSRDFFSLDCSFATLINLFSYFND